MPTSSTNSTMLGCCCCKSGPITAKAWINQIGHAPGQVVYFSAKVENLSGKRLNGSRVQLLQVRVILIYTYIPKLYTYSIKSIFTVFNFYGKK